MNANADPAALLSRALQARIVADGEAINEVNTDDARVAACVVGHVAGRTEGRLDCADDSPSLFSASLRRRRLALP